MRTINLAIAGFIALAPIGLAANAAEFATTKIKQCSVEWKAAKASPTDTNVEATAAGWPKFWSACSKHHNAEGDTFVKGTRARKTKAAPVNG